MLSVLSTTPAGPRLQEVLTILDGDDRSESAVGTSGWMRADRLEGAADWLFHVWPDGEAPSGLLNTVVSDALESDLFTGQTPETWSPLGRVDHGRAGHVERDEYLVDGLPVAPEESISSAVSLRLHNASAALPGLTLTQDDFTVGAILFAADSYVSPIPADSDGIEVSYDPDGGEQFEEWMTAARELRRLVPDGILVRLLLWRCYFGSNTGRSDGATELRDRSMHDIHRGARVGSGVLVGRVVYTAYRLSHRGNVSDPTFSRRLRSLKAKHPNGGACPDLLDLFSSDEPRPLQAIVAIHGTMASAIPLAETLRDMLGWSAPIYRFEHDTWHPIGENAAVLVNYLRVWRAQADLLVAHSRGGLVARHAATEASAARIATEIEVITAGTPFRGTEVVDGVEGGLLAVRALLGVIRMANGGPAIDATTRLAGLVIGGKVPRGIAAMSPTSDYLSQTRNLPTDVALAVAGAVDLNSITDHYALAGFGKVVFDGAANDLVVTRESAHGGSSNALTVTSDHFSYFVMGEVADQIRSHAHR
jgi:hypothetical protein